MAILETKLEILEERLKMCNAKSSDAYDFENLELHPKFNREWYPIANDWVTKNYEKDSIEQNRKLVEFTNQLEQFFIKKLKTLAHGKYDFGEGEISPEIIMSDAFNNDDRSQMHELGLKLQQAYVSKMIQFYNLDPKMFNATKLEFCEVFGRCQ